MALETINANSALFSPTYGHGRWPMGRHRWLFRGLLYATLASGGLLHVHSSDLLSFALNQDWLVYSGEP